MKTLVIFLTTCVVSYCVYDLYRQNPADLPAFAKGKNGLFSDSSSDGARAQGTAPDLSLVPIGNGKTLTNARVKSARANSILFMCDQGIFDVSYDRLPPEFRTFYAPAAPVLASNS
jgi:hypothetical protein